MRISFPHRIGIVLAKAEVFYLNVLRAAILIIATLLIGYAAWIVVKGIYKMSHSPDSVKAEIARVGPDEITNAEMPLAADEVLGTNAKDQLNADHQQYYDDFVNRYYNLFKTHFEPFRQPEDKVLTPDEFDDSFINTSQRMESVARGTLSFDADRQDLESLLSVMTEAAGRPVTQGRLKQYQAAKKIAVPRKVQRTRTTQRQGWNPLSTNCPNWYDPPYGCPETRTVQTPYTETVSKMELPEGTQTHSQIFRAFQDRYFTLLNERRNASVEKADSERRGILDGIAEGQRSLFTALQVIGVFLALMFFFLLIAIERHQRIIAARSASGDPN